VDSLVGLVGIPQGRAWKCLSRLTSSALYFLSILMKVGLFQQLLIQPPISDFTKICVVVFGLKHSPDGHGEPNGRIYATSL
jgi:hypothetical protein